jgi:hypothetical protein
MLKKLWENDFVVQNFVYFLVILFLYGFWKNLMYDQIWPLVQDWAGAIIKHWP